MHGVVDVYGRVENLAGHIVSTLEKQLVVDVPESQFSSFQARATVYQEAVPLRPGRYKVNIILKDDSNGHMGSKEFDMEVPSFGGDQLTHSSLILADQLSPLPAGQETYGPVVIGATRVRPSMNNIFVRDQRLGIYMQVYNLGIDNKTHKPSLDIHYAIEKDGKPVIDQAEDASRLSKASRQFTVAKTIGLHSFVPGKYTVQVKVTDNINRQTVSPSATFEVR